MRAITDKLQMRMEHAHVNKVRCPLLYLLVRMNNTDYKNPKS